ncbi:uncharacterized protein METZ01_LOCUS398172, partial [marine metagenome]
QEECRTPPTIGKGSSFAKKDWWTSGWWLLDKQGHSNDITCDLGTVGDLAVAAASVRGENHRYDGTRCEDSFYLATGSTENEDQFLVAVIGDGIGSAEFSAYGSSRATDLFATKLAAQLSGSEGLESEVVDAAATQLLTDVRKAVKSWTANDYLAPKESPDDVDPSALETTLSFAVIPAQVNSDEDSRPFYWGVVGDSPILKLSDEGWKKVSAGVDGEVLDSATEALHSATGVVMGSGRIANDEVLVLVSDGVGNFLTSANETLAVGRELARRWLRPVKIEPFVSD